jgi:hypothetical protein
MQSSWQRQLLGRQEQAQPLRLPPQLQLEQQGC